MKRSLIVIAFAALSSVPAMANAQGLGILGGFTYGSVPSSDVSGAGSLSSNNGFAVGLGAETGGMFGFGINGLYAQRGYKASNPGFSRKLSYVDVPVYFRFAIPNPVATPFALIGPQFSFELNCDSNGNNCPSGRTKLTYDGVGAIGVKFPMLAGLSVQGRYVYGLQDLNYGTVNNQSNYRQRSFMLLLGLGF